MFGGVAYGSVVDEDEFSLFIDDTVAGVQVAVEGAYSEQVCPVDPE